MIINDISDDINDSSSKSISINEANMKIIDIDDDDDDINDKVIVF